MGELLTEMDLAPDLIVTSSAVRAATTAKLAAEGGQWDCPIRETDDFYEASVATVVEELRKLDDETQRCLIVGHDTTWSGIVRELTGANAAMKTATVAVIDDHGPWKKLGKSPAELVSVLQPRHFE